MHLDRHSNNIYMFEKCSCKVSVFGLTYVHVLNKK
jgi:hypothetical protein